MNNYPFLQYIILLYKPTAVYKSTLEPVGTERSTKLKKSQKVRLRTKGVDLHIIVTTKEELVRPAPTSIDAAIENGLQEWLGFLRSNRKPFRRETINTLKKHIKEHVGQTFQKYMLESENVTESKHDLLKRLWNSIFSPKVDTTGSIAPKKRKPLRSA